MDETSKMVLNLLIGFTIGLLSWIIKDIYENNKIRRRILDALKIQLQSSRDFLRISYPRRRDILFDEEDRLHKVEHHLKFDFYEKNYDKLGFLGKQKCEDIYEVFLFLNDEKDKIIDKIKKGEGGRIEPEIKAIYKIIDELGKSHKVFRDLIRAKNTAPNS